MPPSDSVHKPLHILMASGVPKRREGGVASVIYNLGRELEQRGHTLTYLFQEDLTKPESVSPRFIELIFSWRLARYIARNRRKFSIVNLHGPVGFPYGVLRTLPGSHSLPPYVMTLHGLEERRVHVMSREQRKGRAWTFAFKNRVWHRFYHFPRFRWSIWTSDAVHACCRDVWNILQLKYDLDAERVAYIPHGVEQRFFVPRAARGGGVGIRLLFVGSWLDQRGIFYLRDALPEIFRKVPGMTMTFAGVGVPPRDILQFFGNELSERINVVPVIPADEVQNLFVSHDIFLFPSLMEGLPCVLLEAMAAGMPVITTETCGMPDVVENEMNGLLISPANAHAIEEAVLRLVHSPQLREQLGTAARETMKRYTWERSAHQLEAFYHHILLLEGRSAS